MKNWTVRQRIAFSFGAVIALMIVMGVLAHFRLAVIEREAASLEHDSVDGLYALNQIRAAFITNYALTEELGNFEQKADTADTVAQINANRALLDNLLVQAEPTVVQARDRELFASFKVALAAYTQVQAATLQADSAQSRDLRARQLKPAFDKVVAILQDEIDFNKRNAGISTQAIQRDVGGTRLVLLGSFVVVVLCALIFGYYLFQAITQPLGQLVRATEVMSQGNFSQRISLTRQDEFATLATGFNRMTDELTALVGQVHKSGIQVSTSVTEIAATAREQQATATEIAATTTEIGATSKEISATSKELVKTMSEVSVVAEQSATLAGSGQTGLSRMEETMRHVMEAAGAINAKLAVLNEKAGNITQVVTTITKVADQTNLLSLNAAIEAEKAGEYGRGFAVVATEIRRLADQTAVATYDIELMVKEIQSAVSAGVMGMDKFSEEVRRGMQEIQQVGGQLSQIIQQVQALAPRFEAVNEGMQAQATGAGQISQALTQLSEAAQQTVESLRQSGLAIDQLNETSHGLKASVERIKL